MSECPTRARSGRVTRPRHSRHPESSTMNEKAMRITRLVTSAAILASAACSDVTGSRQGNISSAALTAALSTVPVGYGDLSSSFVGTSMTGASTGEFWLGGGRDAHFDNGGMMGGGLEDNFIGAVGFGVLP